MGLGLMAEVANLHHWRRSEAVYQMFLTYSEGGYVFSEGDHWNSDAHYGRLEVQYVDSDGHYGSLDGHYGSLDGHYDNSDGHYGSLDGLCAVNYAQVAHLKLPFVTLRN